MVGVLADAAANRIPWQIAWAAAVEEAIAAEPRWFQATVWQRTLDATEPAWRSIFGELSTPD
jgi:hypothetical protein